MTTRGRHAETGEGQPCHVCWTICLSVAAQRLLILRDEEWRCETELGEGIDTGSVLSLL